MAVQLMINVKLWSTVTVGGGDTVMMGDPRTFYYETKTAGKYS